MPSPPPPTHRLAKVLVVGVLLCRPLSHLLQEQGVLHDAAAGRVWEGEGGGGGRSGRGGGGGVRGGEGGHDVMWGFPLILYCVK